MKTPRTCHIYQPHGSHVEITPKVTTTELKCHGPEALASFCKLQATSSPLWLSHCFSVVTEALWVEGRSSGNKQARCPTVLPYEVSPKMGFTAPTDKRTMKEEQTTWQNSLIGFSDSPFNSSALVSEALPFSLFFYGHSRGKEKKLMSSFYNCLVLDCSTFKMPSQLL